MAETWPPALFPVAQSWSKGGVSATGGRTIGGFQQVVRSDAGFWVCRMTLEVPYAGGRGEDRTLAFRAMMAQLDGMAGEVDVPCTAPWRPYDSNGRMLRANDVVFPGGRSLFNHGGFAKDEERLMFVRGDVAQGATRMAILHPGVQGLRPGHYFGIGHRLYIVARAWQVSIEDVGGGEFQVFDGAEPVFDGAEPVFDGPAGAGEGLGGSNVEVVDFWPRLREAAPDGTPLTLGRPVCRMRPASDAVEIEQALAEVARPSLTFEEAI